MKLEIKFILTKVVSSKIPKVQLLLSWDKSEIYFECENLKLRKVKSKRVILMFIFVLTFSPFTLENTKIYLLVHHMSYFLLFVHIWPTLFS